MKKNKENKTEIKSSDNRSPDKRLMSEAEKKAKDQASKKNFFLIELYDEINGLMGEPDIFLAEKTPDSNSGSDILIPEDDMYPTIPYPRKIKLTLKDKYPDLATLDKQITKVRKELESFDYRNQGDRNEIDLENELIDCERLRQLYVFGEKHDLVSIRNGFKVLKFFKDGSIYLPLAGSLDARGFAIPGNQEIKQHTHIRTEIEAEFRSTDKFSWINATNILVLVLVVAIGLAAFSAYGYHKSEKAAHDKIEEYEIAYQKLLQERSKDVSKFGTDLVKLSQTCGNPATSDAKAGETTPPQYNS